MKPYADDAKKMKVLHIAETIKGGIGTYLNTLLRAQAREPGIDEIHVLIPEQARNEISEASPKLHFHAFQRKHRNLSALFALATQSRNLIYKLNPTVTHLHSSFAGLVVRMQCLPSAIVYCPHGWAFSQEKPKPIRATYALIERFLARFCRAIIVISEHERDAALAHGLPASKLRRINHGLWPLVDDSLPRRARDDGALRLLFVGRLDPQKGFDWLHAAVRSYTGNLSLRVAGEAVVVPGLRAMDQVDDPRITFLGWLPPTAISREVLQADIVVMPSRWEGFGLVAIEAMRAGTPVIATRRGALPEVIGDDGGWLIEFGDTAALHALLQRLSVGEIQRMGAQALRRFNTHFHAENMSSHTMTLYRDIV